MEDLCDLSVLLGAPSLPVPWKRSRSTWKLTAKFCSWGARCKSRTTPPEPLDLTGIFIWATTMPEEVRHSWSAADIARNKAELSRLVATEYCCFDQF